MLKIQRSNEIFCCTRKKTFKSKRLKLYLLITSEKSIYTLTVITKKNNNNNTFISVTKKFNKSNKHILLPCIIQQKIL